jgi:hypothetical protein
MRVAREDDQDCPACQGSGWLDRAREVPVPRWRRRACRMCSAGLEREAEAEAAAEAEVERRAEDRRRDGWR